jgi:hypothetical protein
MAFSGLWHYLEVQIHNQVWLLFLLSRPGGCLMRQGGTYSKHCFHISRYGTTTISPYHLTVHIYSLYIVLQLIYESRCDPLTVEAVMTKYIGLNARDLEMSKDHKDHIMHSPIRDAKHELKIYAWDMMWKGREVPIRAFEWRTTNCSHGCCCHSSHNLERQGVKLSQVSCTRLHKNRHDQQKRSWPNQMQPNTRLKEWEL